MDEHASVYAGRGRLTAGGGRYIALAFDQPPPPPFLPLLTQLPSSRMRSNAKSLCTTMLVSARLIRFYERFKCHPPRHSTSSSPLFIVCNSCDRVYDSRRERSRSRVDKFILKNLWLLHSGSLNSEFVGWSGSDSR